MHGRGSVVSYFWTPSIIVVLILSFLLTFFHYYILPKLFNIGAQIVVQMFCDTFIAVTVIIFTGGYDSTLNFIFLVVVINSAFLGGLRISFIAATLSAMAWAGILDLHYYGYLPGLMALGIYMSSVELALNILVNTGATYLVAILSGHLSTQLDLSSRALVFSQASLDRLSEVNENIIRSIDYGLITTDNQGLILSINPAGRELLKVSSSSFFGVPWRSLFPELDTISDHKFDGNLEQNYHQIKGLRLKHIRPDLVELDIELSILTLMDVKNEGWGHLLVIKDLTAMNQMESEIKRSEHMAAVGQLAAGLAHEIRTPLASMSGSWHMLLNQSLKAEDQNRLMNIIGREMDRLETLVEDFLSFARPTAGNPQPININSLIKDQAHIFSSWKGESASIELKLNEVPMVYFDYGQLSQVIFNLMQNAMEAVGNNQPHVIVETLRETMKSNYVSVTISDNGSGISEENIKRIFEPFFTTKTKGHGLGLAMVWGIIMRGHGHISVRSTPNILTTFTVLLPILKKETP
jgi:two-component system sensor histidine kinase PilS (NtrC family)